MTLKGILIRSPPPASPVPAPEKALTRKELHKGTGDVLRDLAHAVNLTDTSEPGFGEVICRGRELDFVNRALRVAAGEIKQLRARLKSAPPLPPGPDPQGWQPEVKTLRGMLREIANGTLHGMTPAAYAQGCLSLLEEMRALPSPPGPLT